MCSNLEIINQQPTNLEEIRWLILNHGEPLLFREFLNWPVLKWDLKQWIREIGDEEMAFRCGKLKHTDEPQWERTTKVVCGSFTDFLKFEEQNPNKWSYFDYKYLREYFSSKDDLQNAVSWSEFGFTEFKSKESTIWIGSKGAHTPCHIDTYGCNLIAQIYGKKRWIIFPPEEDLLPSRVPYEESSVYSKLNLFSPDLEKFKGITKCKSVVLNPGEVLFLPHGWWHYVENLEMSISINVWIPLPIDKEKRLEESLVQLLVSQMVKDLSEENRNVVLNTNTENQYLHKQNLMDTINIISTCMESCQEDPRKKIKTTAVRTTPQTLCASDILERYKDRIVTIPYLSSHEIRNLLSDQRSRFQQEEDVSDANDDKSISRVSDIINAFADMNVINLVKSKILKR